MNGRIIVTGATGSMGAAAAASLAHRGIPVLMACRDLEKAAAVRADIFLRVPGADIEVRPLDLASMASVRSFAESVEPGSAVALFNNAGVISKRFCLTEDGFENTFSVNYFGPWLLTQLLLPKLPQDAHVVNMVSLTCRFVSLDEAILQPGEKEFSQLGTYARGTIRWPTYCSSHCASHRRPASVRLCARLRKMSVIATMQDEGAGIFRHGISTRLWTKGYGRKPGGS